MLALLELDVQRHGPEPQDVAARGRRVVIPPLGELLPSRELHANRDRFRTELRHVVLVELPHAGHYVFLTQPDRVEREIRTFLTRVR